MPLLIDMVWHSIALTLIMLSRAVWAVVCSWFVLYGLLCVLDGDGDMVETKERTIQTLLSACVFKQVKLNNMI